MSDATNDLAALMRRLAGGPPMVKAAGKPHRIPKPIYLLSVDDPDERSIILIIREGRDGVPRATIVLPDWHELPAGWDGPHEMDVAVSLADGYAHEYGYRAIAIDIESSQIWQPEWGRLDIGNTDTCLL